MKLTEQMRKGISFYFAPAVNVPIDFDMIEKSMGLDDYFLMKKSDLAKSIATSMHSLQSYGDGHSYDKHLQDVVNTLIEFGYNTEDRLCAAWLHDTVEDTPMTLGQIADRFGSDIANMVYAVTSERGMNRKERNSKTYYKLLKYPEAIPVKLADRISNVRHSKQGKGETRYFNMYKDEYVMFREILYKEDEFVEMWQCLDTLLEFNS